MSKEEATRIVDELRTTYPGIVEEWERQRADGNDDWPHFQTVTGLQWWLDSEVVQTQHFILDDETGREQALQAFCLTALQRLSGRQDGDA